MFWIWFACISVICGAALRLGGAAERWGAGIIFAGWLLSVAMIWLVGAGYGLGVALVDIATLIALVALALKSRRYWPLWAAGFHLLAVMTHWAHQLDPTVNHWTYVTAGIIWGYLLIGALAFGTYGAWREQRQLAKAGLAADPGATLR